MKTTHLIIALNVFVFLAMIKVGGVKELTGFSAHTLMLFGANAAPNVLRAHQWYRPMTSMFIHMNAIHILMNMGALTQMGPKLEEYYGRWRYLILYVASGLIGSLFSIGLQMIRGMAISAGASGAICGLIGAAALIGHLAGTPEGRRFRDQMLIWIVMTYIFGLAVHADHAAHTGGLLGGAGLAYLFRKARPMKAEHLGFESLVLLGLVGVSFGQAARSRLQADAYSSVNHGVELAHAGDDDGAIASYRLALQLEPNDEIALLDLGLALARKGDLAGAEESFRASIKSKPSRAAYDSLAHALFLQKRFDEAREAEKSAEALPPDSE